MTGDDGKVTAVTPKHALGRLIADVMQTNGWTLADVSRRASQHGQQLSPQNVSRLRNEPIVSVVGKWVQALAYGLDLPPATIATAAVQSMGFTIDGPAVVSPEDSIAHDQRLSERDRRLVLAVLRELRAEEVVGDAEQPAPKIQAPSGANVRRLRERRMEGLDGVELMAARRGTPANPPDVTTGEESQDPGGDDPA